LGHIEKPEKHEETSANYAKTFLTEHNYQMKDWKGLSVF